MNGVEEGVQLWRGEVTERRASARRRPGAAWWSRAVLLVAIVGLPAGCGPPQLTSLEEDLAEAAVAALAGDGLVDVREVTDLEWDRMIAFGPYTSPNHVREELGVRMPRAAHAQMATEGHDFIAFMDDEDLVGWVVLDGRFVGPLEGTYPADGATFTVEGSEDLLFLSHP